MSEFRIYMMAIIGTTCQSLDFTCQPHRNHMSEFRLHMVVIIGTTCQSLDYTWQPSQEPHVRVQTIHGSHHRNHMSEFRIYMMAIIGTTCQTLDFTWQPHRNHMSDFRLYMVATQEPHVRLQTIHDSHHRNHMSEFRLYMIAIIRTTCQSLDCTWQPSTEIHVRVQTVPIGQHSTIWLRPVWRLLSRHRGAATRGTFTHTYQ